MVAAGSTLSAFWILAANSWQQTPAGFVIKNNRAELTSLWDAAFNPSTIVRFFHTIDATLIVAAFFMAGIASHLLMHNRKVDIAKKSLRLAIISGLIASVLQLMPFGHEHAKQVAITQPEKFAVFEGVYETQSHAPMLLFGIPTDAQQKLKWTIEIPGLLSWITFGDTSATIKGIKDFPIDELPPRILPFVAFHTMVALGLYFIMVMLFGIFQLYRNRLWDNRLFLKLSVWSIPLPVIASQLGWIAAEVGRQPWIIYRVMRTKEAVSLSVSRGDVLSSIILFSLLYTFLGALYIYIMRKEVN
jgi:cytochrome d ubiquinol oxidase subunit I